MKLPKLFLLVTCVLLHTTALANAEFPRPKELERDVRFWTKVYTQADTKSGYIHDSENLAVVYEKIQLGENSRANRKLIKATKEKYEAILKRLAAGKRNNLTTEEQQVLNLWGEGVGNGRFKRGAENLRFQLGQSDRFREGLIRSGEWKDYIAQVFSERGLPRELTILPHVESSFNPKAYSSAGAAGLWQFTRPTGRRFMDIDYVVDERMDPFAATIAAAELLKHNKETTGTWPLALTAYNHGAASMRRATRELGTTDIETIVRKYKGRAFGFASRNFYVSFLAALEVSDNPEKYFGPIPYAKPFDYHHVVLDEYLLVESFARAFGTNLATLKRHNRSLMAPVWDGSKRIPRGYGVRIPKDQVNGSPTNLLASIPDNQRFDEQTPDLFHKVVRGDTVSEIARRYGHSTRQIANMNGLDRRYRIRIGQTLRLPVAGAHQDAVAVAAAEETGQPPALVAAGPKLDSTDRSAIAPAEFNVALAENGDAGVTSDSSITVAQSDSGLLVDPADYSVTESRSIEVQASETLGHYAEWLDIRASRLRQINNMRYGVPLVLGRRLQLDFSRVDVDTFEKRRLAFQRSLQESFFMSYQIHRTRTHVVRPGESLWALSKNTYRVPIWLLKQYNPDINLNKMKPGMKLTIPELVES